MSSIANIPESFLRSPFDVNDIYIYDFKMTQDAINSRVNLTSHMFSFLQTGNKKVHLEDSFVEVNNKQSVLIKSGNCLMTELLENDQIYFCKLLFFTSQHVSDFVSKYQLEKPTMCGVESRSPALFVIENDDFIHSFVQSLSSILLIDSKSYALILQLKLEEIMLYLLNKYQSRFVAYIHSLICNSHWENISFRKIIEANDKTHLNLNEIAFLCNMSLSTFKRHFFKEYQVSPGKWFQQKRLQHARFRLLEENKKPSEIFRDYGYENLSNFSSAFKKEFGIYPKDVLASKK
ncbi:helix-turn-helix domain-containing protein [Aquirufa sp. ROCK2-A2]